MRSLSPAQRRVLGAFRTPDDVADRLVAVTLDKSAAAAPTVCDPACGDGSFLLAAGRALASRGIARDVVARHLLWGCDIDPAAARAARAAIASWSGVDPADHVVAGDGLTLGDRWPSRFDAVVGNPPFLNQLARATTRTDAVPRALAPFARAYTDTAWLFLLVARALLAPGGRATMIQPQSIVSARDAAPVRDALADDVAGLWWCDERVFDAEVRVCAVVLDGSASAVQRWVGRGVHAIPSAPRARDWTTIVPTDVPRVDVRNTRTLRDIATATAGFRDEYYGLVPHVVDAPCDPRPMLVTSGSIDVNTSHWGHRPVRFARRRFLHPRVDVAALERRDARVGRWVRARLVPKVVVATQTRVVEAAVDVRGEWVPSTPVISVHAPEHELWRVAAVLLAPPVSAWALARSAGAALDRDAIKLSARAVHDIPLPSEDDAWAAAAAALAAGDVTSAARAMTDAYGAPEDVFHWWRNRQGRRA